ncbi:cupin domain-containing protein [Martelella sp. HB161492]|uniref:cupin domain-containing protein n=1 Tax=Martelella sp. HB161492 TaxID=2720726 RepID=UPI001591239F|nr:cupin domain-containing protein [Martelella sp. HB161492]
MNAHEIIAMLGMERHPEGGYYVETYRDLSDGSKRGVSSLIYFLLEDGDRSHWHRLHTASEVWHFYAGAPLVLSRFAKGGINDDLVLGIDLAAGERPQAVVPAGCWQAAESLGDFTLVGCTVAPGFDFTDFELAEPGWSPRGPA